MIRNYYFVKHISLFWPLSCNSCSLIWQCKSFMQLCLINNKMTTCLLMCEIYASGCLTNTSNSHLILWHDTSVFLVVPAIWQWRCLVYFRLHQFFDRRSGDPDSSWAVSESNTCGLYTLVWPWEVRLQEFPLMAFRLVQKETDSLCWEDPPVGDWPHWSSCS